MQPFCYDRNSRHSFCRCRGPAHAQSLSTSFSFLLMRGYVPALERLSEIILKQ